jgi:hypothetical protein
MKEWKNKKQESLISYFKIGKVVLDQSNALFFLRMKLLKKIGKLDAYFKNQKRSKAFLL